MPSMTDQPSNNLVMAWNLVEHMLDDMVPGDKRLPSRLLLDEAITCLVVEAENQAAVDHGQQILLAIGGEAFQRIRCALEDADR
jgi:hypothetical protein